MSSGYTTNNALASVNQDHSSGTYPTFTITGIGSATSVTSNTTTAYIIFLI